MHITENLPLKDLIRKRRQELGITQNDIAKAVGVTSPDFICLVEKGVRRLDLDRIPTLAELLRVDPAELCALALGEQFPMLAQTLIRSNALRNRFSGHIPTEVNVAAERLGHMTPLSRRLALNMINTLYEQETVATRSGEAAVA